MDPLSTPLSTGSSVGCVCAQRPKLQYLHRIKMSVRHSIFELQSWPHVSSSGGGDGKSFRQEQIAETAANETTNEIST